MFIRKVIGAVWLSTAFGAAAQALPAAAVSDFLPRALATPGREPEKFKFVFGPAIAWSGPVHWSYNHAGAPAGVSSNPSAVVIALQNAVSKWTAACGVRFVYDGPTSTTN